MKTLLVLRHAKSSWSNSALSDHERPLNKRGRRDAPRMGRLLRAKGLVPDLIISSTAERALTTTEAVALACGYEGEIESTRHFYLASPSTYIEFLQSLAGEPGRVMIVGHNPGMENLVTLLTGEEERFPTAALAQIELPIERWRGLNHSTRGNLVNLWRPKELATED